MLTVISEIAGACLPSHALAFEPDVLAGHDADGNFDVDVLAVRQVQPLRRAVGRVGQRHRHLGLNVGADAEILLLERRATATAAARCATKRLAQNIFEAAGTACRRATSHARGA